MLKFESEEFKTMVNMLMKKAKTPASCHYKTELYTNKSTVKHLPDRYYGFKFRVYEKNSGLIIAASDVITDDPTGAAAKKIILNTLRKAQTLIA
jgi:hypothetical protein